MEVDPAISRWMEVNMESGSLEFDLWHLRDSQRRRTEIKFARLSGLLEPIQLK